MIQPIMKDIFFLQQQSEAATPADLQVGKDLQDTLAANSHACVGMAANMIGVKKRVIVVNVGFTNLVMYNPVLISKTKPYQAEEGCLSLEGIRPTARYQEIEVEFWDSSWKKQSLRLTDFQAQIVQHELDHLEGIII
ncbi:peptide deformylase [Streptococcus ruminantium]|uniref:Peptide deformylase n=1 Tax=Streptococcus ruminantium TaxID=1917441 RepID=A0ABU1B4U8_9STRE|nr:peptide deformylase [Streptococcus ruminantium]MDQ8760053.1 peptide deformylase [Streptococcus ruminantium]MDQ8765846.1 peptide deformylase [Streptococcus ruminantium]MDQ8769293.1 peptide deformylase [Streptococcus ruminantium]MDQ8775186.1 peptide deformylase [Streptococcus ruminantium]MDQ8794572.1 peptide deformylase [Streptococcus ruminantium]